MKYEKPDFEEIDLILEGSFLDSVSDGKGWDVDRNDNPEEEVNDENDIA